MHNRVLLSNLIAFRDHDLWEKTERVGRDVFLVDNLENIQKITDWGLGIRIRE